MKSAKILVVDDEQEVRADYARILEAEGYDVSQAATGDEALRRAHAERPDLMLLDVSLPDASGVEVCRRIKADPELAASFVINVSGMETSTESETEVLEAGADGYLSKPLQERQLLANIKAFLRIKATEKTLRESEASYRRLAEELKESNRRLEEYNRLKAEFVANMSHELRTPLTAIIGFANLVQITQQTEPIPDVCANAFERILRNGRHLLALIDDVLDISKIEAGRMKVHREHFDLVEMAQETFGELQSLAEQKQIGYTLRIADHLPVAFTDPLRVRQVFVNLLSNAIKFTKQGAVEAELMPWGENEFRFVVRDTGVGIDEQALSVIFERFRQVDGSMTRMVGGAGLGLSIVRQIVELLGGHIDVTSERGRGSIFIVTLPLTGPEPGLPESLAASAFRQSPAAAHAASGEASAVHVETAEKDANDLPLVLIIEDDADAAALLSETISRAGYRVRVARDGTTGLQLARELEPSAVTLDVMMPGMDGWRVLQALKSDRRMAQIPVIVCSIVDSRPLGYRLGASDYLLKPVEPEKLLSTLSGVCAEGVAADEGYVLVVDDERGIRELLTTALRQAGYNARSAASGETALKMIGQAVPRVVLCDLMMPGGMSGYEFVARLRSEPQTAHTPVVIITGKDMMPEDRRLISGQIANVIRKGDLLMSGLEQRLRETLEEIGVEPSNGKDTGS
ncbi:MAG TPA: response regulator [Pyrinomonadaceae bacterium]|nr:response regulator [Pyrinomonadaceae bacterium]